MSDKEALERIWTLMQEIGVAMMVTHSSKGGAMRARPMGAIPERHDDTIYFFTDAETPKDHEIAGDSQVCLIFADTAHKRYVSLAGTAEVRADPEIVARYWNDGLRAFWEGPHDPRLRVIRVTPDHGEFWEEPNYNATFVSMAKHGEKAKLRM